MRAARCEHDLNWHLREGGGGKRGELSVYTVMLLDLAFPLFKQVGKT